MTKEMTGRFGISLLAMLCLATVSLGDAYTITSQTASEDGYRVTGGDAGTPSVTGNYLYLDDGTWGFVQFDLAQGAGESIDSVTLANLSLTLSTYGDKSTHTFNLRRMTEAIDESNPRTFQPGELPAYDTTTVVTFSVSSSTTPVYTPFDVDVSSLLADNGDRQTFGVLILRQTTGSNAQAYSNNNAAAGYRPRLSAEYTTTIPEPGTLLVLCVGAGLVCPRRKKA
ncbi:MAG: hypothetical protein JXA11_08695 [Phycisphaerae bacterium]|nr:hypothetical protein [Phycisphaerae bacterium]